MSATIPCIDDQLIKSSCYCLNESSQNSFGHLLAGDSSLGVTSDSDEQLIIHLALLQTFKLSYITIGILGNETCPGTVKLFANKGNLGFSDAADTPATQQIQLSHSTDGKPSYIKIDLQAAKWQSVDSLTIFIEDNHGAEHTFIHSVHLYGVPIHGMNVSNIQSGWYEALIYII